MKLILTHDQMMSEWRLRRGVEPLRADSTVTRTFGLDFTRLIEAEMLSWYARLLDTAPLSMLAPVNLAPDIELTADRGFESGATVALPGYVRRVTSVWLAHWHRPVTPEPLEENRHLLRRQSNPFTAAVPDAPVALTAGDRLLLFPATALSVPVTIEAITDRSPDEYRLDNRAFELVRPDTPMLL